ncbi:MAG: hypothetical protein M1826_002907 [Phylliscum demangeonii]|nr:MAG: hypothetical protein M1826_002907 [Phylliscum demangeonii]
MGADGYRIPQAVFQAVSGVMFGLAMIAAVVRTGHRLRSHRRLFADDLFLLIACVFLTAGIVVFYQATKDVYLPFWSWILLFTKDLQALQKKEVSYQQRVFAFESITWTSIFAVKFAFLFFFRVLVNRIRYMTIYWRVVLGFTIIAFGICVSEAGIECPHFDVASLQCGIGSGLDRSVSVTAAAIVLDFMTDLMIIALPIHLLWKVRMKTNQKLGLGVFLCLSVFMMITAVVRISALHMTVVVLGRPITAIDVTWKLFWQQMEASLAVLMVSLTALRSIFVSDGYHGGGHARQRPTPPKMSPVGSSRQQRYWPSRKKYASSDGSDSTDGDAGPLPSIPSATITGLRTFIRGGRGGGAAGITKTTTLRSEVYEEKTIVAAEPVAVAVPEPVLEPVAPRRHEHGVEEV